jgi:2-iminobutanoate/2-iminopropanoate deaminase
VLTDSLVFVSGQVPRNEAGTLVSDDFEEQVGATLDNLGRCLAAAGCSFESVVKVNAYLLDLADFGVFNQIYGRYFDVPPFPARTTVRADLMPGFQIEIDAIAVRGG